MRTTALSLALLASIAFGACADAPPAPTAPENPSEAAIALIMAELSDARTLEVAAELHGQTIGERIDHLGGLLQWFADQAGDDDLPETVPAIDTAFTLISMQVDEPLGPGEETPEMMSGMIHVYTKATVSGALSHQIRWDYDSYTEQIEIPKNLRYFAYDLIAGDELFTQVGCFYLPNERQLPNDRVDYWAYAETIHSYAAGNPVIHFEQDTTSFLQDTRHPRDVPIVVTACPGAGGF